MDWDKVEISKDQFSERQRKPATGQLATLDYAKLLVISKLIGKPINAIIQTAIYTYLSRNWAEHETRLAVEARSKGLTPEEYFNQLAAGTEDKPEG